MLSSAVLFRVLVIDDEHVIANTLAKIFSTSGYDARAVYSAEEALAILPEWLPQLAIIDVFLPGLNGIDLAITLKEKYVDMRVLLFSGQAATSNLLEGTQQVGYSFEILAKPVHPTEILSAASRLLSGRNNEIQAI
jgi:DNA-binding NtrC family response regulator